MNHLPHQINKNKKNSNPGMIFRGVYCLISLRKDSSGRSKRKGQLNPPEW